MPPVKRETRATGIRGRTKVELPSRQKPEIHSTPSLCSEVKLRNITNTLKMSATGGPEETTSQQRTKRMKKSNSPTTGGQTGEQCQPPASELIAFEKLRFVLGRHYFAVCDRLALVDYVPRCTRNVPECAQRHVSKRSSRTKCVGPMRLTTTNDQLLEHRPDQFVLFLNQAIMRREFVGVELFVTGLQLMLTVNHPSTELGVDYQVQDIVLGTGEALERCLEHFPPCRWDMRPAYQRIVYGQLDAPCFAKCDQSEGLFRNVLHLIEHLIETDEDKTKTDRSSVGKRTNRGKSKPDDEIFFSNYNSWMSSNRLCYDFDQLPREERFQRLFAVLQILVKLLEMDLAMWILRHPTKTHQNICNPSRCPLVAKLVWNGDHGSVNLFIKKLFQTFICMNALQYPNEDIAIVSRLINLVTVAVNLSEFQLSDGLIPYPCVKDNSQHYARQLWKTLESSRYFSIGLCLRTIQNLRSSFLKLRLSEQLIQKLNRRAKLGNVRGFFQQLLERCWMDYEEQTPMVDVEPPSSLYPVLDTHRTRAKASEIYQQEYIDLLLVALRAYCDMYQLPAYFRENMVQPSGSGVSSNAPDATECIVSQPDEPDERMIFQGVAVTGELVLEYRDDIKYLLLIEQHLKKLTETSTEERELFRHWISFLSEVDPSLAIG
uniref:Uncharacterized protein n=1 Tax=Anopheles farauti TaxID=69004 RepID=A0A182QWJ4_9DIPT